MLRILQTIRRARDERARWRRTRAGAVSLGADGLSSFQRLASQAITTEFPGTILERCGEKEVFLQGVLAGSSCRVFIYTDQAEVVGASGTFNGEHYDFSSPSDLVAAFMRAATEGRSAP